MSSRERPAATVDLSTISFLPEGISVERNVFARDRQWVIYDRLTGLAGVVAVDTHDHEVEWTPPPKVKWWRWIEPLGAALDSIDREHRIARMRGRKVVDWDAVDAEAKEKGAVLIRDLIARRP